MREREREGGERTTCILLCCFIVMQDHWCTYLIFDKRYTGIWTQSQYNTTLWKTNRKIDKWNIHPASSKFGYFIFTKHREWLLNVFEIIIFKQVTMQKQAVYHTYTIFLKWSVQVASEMIPPSGIRNDPSECHQKWSSKWHQKWSLQVRQCHQKWSLQVASEMIPPSAIRNDPSKWHQKWSLQVRQCHQKWSLQVRQCHQKGSL